MCFKYRQDLVACDCVITAREQLGSFYADSLTHDPDALLTVLKLVGPYRVCFGSDCFIPFQVPLGEVPPGQLWSPCWPGSMVEGMASCSKEQKAKILWSNVLAREIQGLQDQSLSDFFLGEELAAVTAMLAGAVT